jgi:threonine synthase
MKFRSTNNQSPSVDIKQAILNGLAPDGGLYMPEFIPALPQEFFRDLPSLTLPEIGIAIVQPFLKDVLKPSVLERIVHETLNFEIPVIEVRKGIHVLELFHGPTLAFKDVGARFLARVIGAFVKHESRELKVLAATSGDTGSAVAHGFLNVQGVRAIVLYPKGRVTALQEKQFATLGQNITAVEVHGTFDDCQRLVKLALQDEELKQDHLLTSANSINFARLLPQAIYYFHAHARLQNVRYPFTVAIPSGNFGNLFAAALAKRMGLPIAHIIAATNANAVVPEYLESGRFAPRQSIQTIANAMDVGRPSNFARIMDLYGGDHAQVTADISGFSLDDAGIRETMRNVLSEYNYQLDPHGAVGYAALESQSSSGLFLATAHPAKFKEVVDQACGTAIELPPALSCLVNKAVQRITIPNDFEALKQILGDAGKRVEGEL